MRPAILLLVIAIGACGSKKKKESGEGSATPAGSAQPITTGITPPAASGALVWDEVRPIIKKGGSHVDIISAPLPAPIADPDAVVARYQTECPKGPTSTPCKDLKLQVEQVLLDTIIGLRAAQDPIDRKWWLTGASADLPQLACLSVFTLSRGDRTPEEEAAVVAAFEHPAPSVRMVAAAIPAVAPLWARVESGSSSMFGCTDGRTDRAYDLRWAGNYPTAKYRYFASSAKRRWFTTSDSIEKVTEFFTKAGKPPATEPELQAQMSQKISAEVMRMTQGSDGDVEKMNSRMLEVTAELIPPKLNVDGAAGDIRYVNLNKNLWIAVFKDDVLKATSIVALAPAKIPNMTQEALQNEMEARRVYGR